MEHVQRLAEPVVTAVRRSTGLGGIATESAHLVWTPDDRIIVVDPQTGARHWESSVRDIRSTTIALVPTGSSGSVRPVLTLRAPTGTTMLDFGLDQPQGPPVDWWRGRLQQLGVRDDTRRKMLLGFVLGGVVIVLTIVCVVAWQAIS